jgi:cytochrome b involved in lipid metabolism
VLDNQILAINDFEHFHPGGAFTLAKNYGRDVTKFFNGAYKLVNVKNEI